MKSFSPAIVIGTGAVLALVAAPASGAFATDITNPADNPAPITVVIGGQTYTDGLDTLPGYDDIACTTIPDVSYDFPNNAINYPDGQTAHWTEWDRIPGYQVWLDQQKAATPKPTASATPKPSASPSSSSSATASSGSTTAAAPAAAPATTSGSTTKSTTKTTTKTTTVSGSKSTAKPSPKPTTSIKSTGTTKETASPTAAATTEPVEPTGEPTEQPTPEAVAVTPADEPTATPDAGAAAEPVDSTLTSSLTDATPSTTGAGIAILAALTLAGAGTLGVHRFGRRFWRARSTERMR